MRIEGVKGVFFGEDFITVTKENEEENWAVIKPDVFATIMDHIQSGKPVFSEDAAVNSEPTDTSDHILRVISISVLLFKRFFLRIAKLLR